MQNQVHQINLYTVDKQKRTHMNLSIFAYVNMNKEQNIASKQITRCAMYIVHDFCRPLFIYLSVKHLVQCLKSQFVLTEIVLYIGL